MGQNPSGKNGLTHAASPRAGRGCALHGDAQKVEGDRGAHAAAEISAVSGSRAPAQLYRHIYTVRKEGSARFGAEKVESIEKELDVIFCCISHAMLSFAPARAPPASGGVVAAPSSLGHRRHHRKRHHQHYSSLFVVLSCPPPATGRPSQRDEVVIAVVLVVRVLVPDRSSSGGGGGRSACCEH